jgi:hypothetical protein
MVTHPTADPEREELFAYDADQDWRSHPDEDESGHLSHTSPARPKGHHHQRSEPDTRPGPELSPPAGPGPSEHAPDRWADLLDDWCAANRVRLVRLLLDRYADDLGRNDGLDVGARLLAWKVGREHRT